MATRIYVTNAINLSEAERASYAQQIIDGRKQNHISQKLLADTIHCHRQQISMAEHGQYRRKEFYLRVLDGINAVKRQRLIAQLQAQIAISA